MLAFDANGNSIISLTDTLGVTALTWSMTADSSGNAVSNTYSYPVLGGHTGSVVVNYKLYPKVASGFGCPGVADFFFSGQPSPNGGGGVTLVDNVALADGSKYSFTYEPTPTSSQFFVAGAVTGRLQSVTLPTGATITYGYPGANGGINCTDGTTMGLTVTTADGTTTYARAINANNTAQTTTVTDPQGNQTVVSFVPITNPKITIPAGVTPITNWVEVQRQVFQGSSTSGTLLQTTMICYNNNKSNCLTTPVTMPVTETSKFTLLANGQENEVDSFFTEISSALTEVDEFDFGANSPGALLRKTVVTNASLGNNILNMPASITVCSPGGSDANCNGSGTVVALTTIGYDETAPSASGATQLASVSGGRGNRTSIHRWLNTNNSTLTTTNTFDDAGNIVSTTDPGGHTTAVMFGCNDAFPIQTNLPDTSSPNLAHHKTSATYDCTTGLLTSSTDQSGNATTYHYDNVLRPSEIDFPDQGKTTYSYPDPNHVTVQRTIDSSRSTSTTTVLDGYGRTSRTATTNGESTPYDQQDSCYDSNGRLGFQSYPYQGNAPNNAATCPNTSLAGDAFAYDALGRPTRTTHSDGTFGGSIYAGRATQITDEGNGSYNVGRILQKDGLGRLVSVCELYSGTALLGSGGTPGSCGLDLTGSGFVTTYGYDLLGNLTSVAQGALAARTYNYDSLSRLTSETTPEAGTVTYTYNTDSLLATRSRPSPNQSSSSVTTTTNYAYDALHRLTGRTYTNDPTNTPPATFNYDETSVWGTSLRSTAGMLTSESVGSPVIAKQVFSYDAMARTALNVQCTPNTCNASPFTPYSLGYQYDLIGDVTSAGNGAGVTFTSSFNIGGRLTSITSSLSDANHPSTLLSNAHYSPAAVSDTLGNGEVEDTSFSRRGALASYLTGTPGGQPGTASVAITGTLQNYQSATSGGSFSISGGDRAAQVSRPFCVIYPKMICVPVSTVHDAGSVSVTVNGFTAGANYDANSTSSSLATALVNALTAPGSPVTATVSGNGSSVTMTAIEDPGAAATYSWSASSASSNSSFGGTSFPISPASGTVAGGNQGGAFQPVPDYGSTTITVNGRQDVYSWSGSGTTAASIAQGLCNAINADPDAFVTANTNGTAGQCPLGSTTISLVSRQSGQNYSLTASSNSVANSFSIGCPGFANCTSASLTGGTAVYAYNLGRASDGQITSASDSVNGPWSFAYDPFNRLANSNKNSGQQTFAYVTDRYSNRWQQNAPQGGPAPQYMFDNNNHFNGSGVTYDALGQILTDGLGNSFKWDPEGRLIQVNQGSTIIATYAYDAEGRRVHGPNGEYVYDLSGKMISRFNLSGVWSEGEIYAAGQHIATYSGGTTNFLHGDWLGTKRVMTALNGTISQTCTGFIFGDGVSCTGTNWSSNLFTDDVHDAETNLEYTLNRQYSGTQGRWLIPDPAGLSAADPTDPQSWNRYAYVTNNPVNKVDPTGLDGFGLVNPGEVCMGFQCFNDSLPLFGIGAFPLPDLSGITPTNGLLSDDWQIPFLTLSQHLQQILGGLPWNNPCIMSPISDCGGMDFKAGSLGAPLQQIPIPPVVDCLSQAGSAGVAAQEAFDAHREKRLLFAIGQNAVFGFATAVVTEKANLAIPFVGPSLVLETAPEVFVLGPAIGAAKGAVTNLVLDPVNGAIHTLGGAYSAFRRCLNAQPTPGDR
jgi:RHS repeat-associated protein